MVNSQFIAKNDLRHLPRYKDISIKLKEAIYWHVKKRYIFTRK